MDSHNQPSTRTRVVDVFAPDATAVSLWCGAGAGGTAFEYPMDRSAAGRWTVEVAAADGTLYWLTVDGGDPLVDPSAADLVFVDGSPRGVFRAPWRVVPGLGRHHDHPVIYEAHVRGLARTFAGVGEHIPYLAELGVDVIELLPVHPFDTSDNYWGYMPVVWGAVHRDYAADGDAPGELASLTQTAHGHGIEVWLDVVFNHTGEGDASMPTWTLRGLADRTSYRRQPDGTYTGDSGCGNDIDPGDAEVRRLVLEALDRFADLGVDGFRFDLASLLTRDGGGLIGTITEWGIRRGVRLIAEPWDLGSYQVGDEIWPDAWMQWNDQFRDTSRSFIRGEPGQVAALADRVAGSPAVFGGSVARSVNFVTAHDGLTMHDLTVVTSDHHRSWDCGPELRLQQLKNYFTVLLLSRGAAMYVMGDEFARTQDGDPNPYNVDGPRSWVDWGRRTEWSELVAYVSQLTALRKALAATTPTLFGTSGDADTSFESRSLGWRYDDLMVVANAWWEPLQFDLGRQGVDPLEWRIELASADARYDATVLTIAPRSSVVLVRV